MEAAGLIEKVEIPKPLNFRFENIRRLPPPILAFNEVAFSYSGKKEDYLYEKLSFGIEYVSCFSCTTQPHVWFLIAWTHASPSLEPTARENRHCSTLSPALYNQLKAQFLSMQISSSPSTLSTLPINYRIIVPPLNISNGSFLRDSQRRM